MKYIKLFETHQTEADIHKLCDKYYIRDYVINPDMSIDVNGDVHLVSDKEVLTELPLMFNNVSGSFQCFNNSLTTLKGCPKYVGGAFNGYNNKLTSLEYCPEIIEWGFHVENNKLTTLKYMPKLVNGHISIENNPLPIEILSIDKINDLKSFIKHQDDYGIWNKDGSFNKSRFDFFKKDYKDILNLEEN